jgi:hypothetical protein
VTSGVVFGLVPEVDGVGEECGLLVAGEPLEFGLGGEAGGCTGAGGVVGGAVLVGALVGFRGCSLGTDVQLYWNSGKVSSSPVRNL